MIFHFFTRINFRICHRAINNHVYAFSASKNFIWIDERVFPRKYIWMAIENVTHCMTNSISLQAYSPSAAIINVIPFYHGMTNSYLMYANDMWPFRIQRTPINLWFKRSFIATMFWSSLMPFEIYATENVMFTFISYLFLSLYPHLTNSLMNVMVCCISRHIACWA